MATPPKTSTRAPRGVALGAVVAGAGLLILDAARHGATAPLLLFLVALPAYFGGRSVAKRMGPKHLLLVVVPLEAFLLAVLGVIALIPMDRSVLPVAVGLFAVAAGLHGAAEARLTSASSRASLPWVVVPVAALALLVAASMTPLYIGLALAPFAVAAAFLIAPSQDPLRPGPTPLAPYLPWRDASGERLPRTPHAWRRAPATLAYIVGTSAAFAFFLAKFNADSTRAPAAFVRFFVYRIPELATRPDLVFLHLFTSVWINWHIVQVVYVVVLLGLAGLRFEAREGTWRTVLVFYATSIVAGLTAGALLLLLKPHIDAPWVDSAWAEAWTGGSAGAFGILGATAARARRPWLLLLVVALWELNVAIFLLKSYTPAFHLTALAAGYALARYVLRPRSAPASPARG